MTYLSQLQSMGALISKCQWWKGEQRTSLSQWGERERTHWRPVRRQFHTRERRWGRAGRNPSKPLLFLPLKWVLGRQDIWTWSTHLAAIKQTGRENKEYKEPVSRMTSLMHHINSDTTFPRTLSSHITWLMKILLGSYSFTCCQSTPKGHKGLC